MRKKENKKLLIIGWGWPQPNATAAGVRLLQLAEYFLNFGYLVTFVATANENEYAEDLKCLGIQTKQVFLNCDSFDGFITELQPEIVLFDRFLTEEQFGWRVTAQIPNALRILDTEDLHSLRYVREQCFKQHIPFSTERWLQDDKTKREIASIYRCDLSLIISDYEMQLLEQILDSNLDVLHHLPFMLDRLDIPLITPNFESRSDFIFIGGGKHAPNIDAIKYLKNDIWPKIRKQLPNASMNIYGAYLPQQIQELNDNQTRFCIHGKIKNVQEVMKSAKVCLAPLRFGAGIKGKLLQAMQFGTPSVTTKIGAEGMHGKMDWNGSITDNEKDFINAAIDLYKNKTKWEQAQNNGYELIQSRYNKTDLEKQLSFKITYLLNHLEIHRSQNFIGSLLHHQTMNSSKYMGKWIQEKNKHS